MLFHKKADKRLSDIQEGLISATLAVLEIADKLIPTKNESRQVHLRNIIGDIVDSINLIGKTHKQISTKCKYCLKLVLNKNIRALCDKETSDSKHLFGENLLKSMEEAKESFRISDGIVNNSTTKFQKASYQSGSKRSFEYTNSGAGVSCSVSHSLKFQGHKRNHQHQGESSSSFKYVTSQKSHNYRGNLHPM